MHVAGGAFECQLLVGDRRLELGEVYDIPVKFLDSERAMGEVAAGATMFLWEGKIIADGFFLEI